MFRVKEVTNERAFRSFALRYQVYLLRDQLFRSNSGVFCVFVGIFARYFRRNEQQAPGASQGRTTAQFGVGVVTNALTTPSTAKDRVNYGVGLVQDLIQ